MAFSNGVLLSGLISIIGIYLLCPLVSCVPFLEARPQNTTVVEGDRVSMICDLNDDNDKTIFWTYLLGPSRRRYVSSNDYIYPRTGYGVEFENYEVIIDESQQTYELVIKSIKLSTESGTYECGYNYGANRKYTPLATTTISVRPFTESVSCHQYLLPSLGSEISQEYEVACSWSHNQAGVANLYSDNGDSISVDLRLPGHIISRIQSRDTPGAFCRFMLESDTSLTFNAPCIGDNTHRPVRVDPFVSKVALGSNSSFVCTSGNQNYSPEISLDVSVNGRDHQERVFKSGEVLSIVNVQAEDEEILVECQVRISQDVVASSFGSLRIVEVTTFPSRTIKSHRTYGTSEVKIIQSSTSPRPLDKILIVPTVVTSVLICFIVIIIGLLFVQRKLKAQNKISGRMNTDKRTTSTEHTSPDINMKVLESGKASISEKRRSSEPPSSIFSEKHTYSSKIYKSNNMCISTSSEVEGVFSPEYESIEAESTLNESKDISKGLNRSSNTERKQQVRINGLEEEVSETSATPSRLLISAGLHSRPLPRCPESSIISLHPLNDLPPSNGGIAEDISNHHSTHCTYHAYEEINKRQSFPQ
ncbi:uncharacterized protein LOC121414882 [Lytechinus variegatus]|uniref:uncharacterized protein LOC121414882 n=1 Tax=Lytechinus variegatus TaxID=7654 RepID=UPI001BB25EB4|nr:uncharacterized protein LOC121414882 [Lytechinus variegatus]